MLVSADPSDYSISYWGPMEVSKRRVWDIDTLDCVRVLEGHNEAVLALAVGPSFLVSGSYDTTVRFWALDSLRCVRHVLRGCWLHICVLKAVRS